MIIKGTSRAGPAALAAHLGNAEKNERVEVLETRGTVAEDLRGALVELDAYAVGTRCQKSLYHAALSPEPPHRLTPEQRTEAVNALEEKLGLTGHSRVVVMHEKEGREHIHVVWSRIDLAEMRSVSDSHNYRKHEEVARDLERRFGHERVQGAHAERDGVERPDRTPSRSELRQEERTGITGKEVKAEVSALFRSSDGPEAFKAALEDHGYILAKGDRRDFVIIDEAGGVHSLARRLDGVKAPELRAWMSGLDRESLPTILEAQAVQHAASPERDHGELPEKNSGKASEVEDSTRIDLPDLELPSSSRAIETASYRVVDSATGAVGRLGDFFAGGSTVPRDPEADQVNSILAARRSAAAVESIRQCVEDGRSISADDLRSLSPNHIEGIRARGDDYLRELIMRMEVDRQRDRDYGRDRDR
jgi:hypothetical protein